MDTSQEYIKTCDCPEIQDGWKPEVGDWADKGVIVGRRKDFFIIRRWTSPLSGCAVEYNKSQLIFLPRQDQLQGMVMPVVGNIPEGMILYISKWLVTAEQAYGSMEQLWLAFVMWELYQKKWNAEKEAWGK